MTGLCTAHLYVIESLLNKNSGEKIIDLFKRKLNIYLSNIGLFKLSYSVAEI